MDWLRDFLADPLGLAVQGAVIAAFLDLLFGVYAAFKDGTFALDAIGAFIRKHLLGRVFPAGTLAVTAYLTGNDLMAAAASAALALYAAETLASIYGSVRPPAPSEVAKTDAEAAVNPVPED